MFIRRFQYLNYDTKPLPFMSWKTSYELSYFKDIIKDKASILNIFCGYSLESQVIQSYLTEWAPHIKNTDSVIGERNKLFKNVEAYWPLDKAAPNTYDLIMSMGGLDRLSSFEQILGLIQNCYAQLKPNGRLVLTGTTPKTNPEWISRVLKQPILSHGTVVNGSNSEYAEPQYADQNIILLDIEKETAPPFNWDKIVNPDKVSDFLSEDYLWGQNQDKDNAGRQYWVKYLSKKVKDTENVIKVLEVGFGAGVCFQNIISAGLTPDYVEYYGADVTQAFVDYANKHLVYMNPVLIDGKVLPFEDKAFDVVYARHLLEHSADYRPILGEMCRVANKNVFVTFFIAPTEETFDVVKWDSQFYHNHWSRSLLWEYAAKCGFSATHLATFEKNGKIDYLTVFDRRGV